MLKSFIISIVLCSTIGIFCAVYFVFSENKEFTGQLFDYINTHSTVDKSSIESSPGKISDKMSGSDQEYSFFDYKKGDWNLFIIQPGYQLLSNNENALMLFSDSMNLNAYGSMKLNLSYGKSMFTDKKYQQYDEDRPQSKVIKSGFIPDQELLLHLEGNIGKRLMVYIDHDSRKKENTYIMKYKALDDQELVQEINAGQIDIKFNHSKYAVYDNTSTKALGVDVKLKKNNFSLRAFGSVTQGETEVETFKGNASPANYKLADYQYTRGMYYQLEPFKRYDGLNSPPVDSGAYNLVTFTSSPADPLTYKPYPVNIDAAGFELYIDDQNPYNNYNAITLSVDNGNYTKMVSGSDYSINYVTGLITLLKAVPASSRLCAVYTVGGTISTSDPSARTDIFPGKVCVFIKYGYSIHEDLNRNMVLDAGEDKNGDGRLNLDIYEVRSFYFMGNKYLLADNFNIQFLRENALLSKSSLKKIGKYTIDYSNGLLQFSLREPFKSLHRDMGSEDKIYSETQLTNTYQYSRFKISLDYYKEARSFKLKHFNIIPKSVRIKIDKKEIPESLYSVDYTSGYLVFTDPNNPVIGSETMIEIKYEFYPFATASRSFIGGVRADYEINRNLNLGGSFVYTRTSGTEGIPKVGNEPSDTLVFEGDALMKLDGKRLAQFYNTVASSKLDSLPFEITAYGEYAKSYKNVNSFGKGLIDNMESTDEIVGISLAEKDWILSSMPQGFTQNQRGKLFYLFYRDPNNPSALKELSFDARSVDYSVKPGPYNVATGHIDNSIEKKKSQRALVLDFSLNAGECVPVVTRRLSNAAVDFSGLQYVEVSYRYEGASDVSLRFDVGSINEDSDGDSILDTEDTNNNSFLDTDPGAGITEDKGYEFNGNNLTVVGSGPGLSSSTKGNGVLDSEDLNGNGVLDTYENVFSVEAIAVNATETTWQRKRVFIDRSALTQGQTDLLKQVQSVRMYLANNNGIAQSGKLFIDGIKFICSKWRDENIDGIAPTPSQLRINMVNTLNDAEYRADGFMFEKKDEYNSLYGNKTGAELDKTTESALQIEYSLPVNSKASITRRFTKPLDIRFYKTLNIWMNYREFQQGDSITFVLGSSDYDYVEYTFGMDYARMWREVQLALKKGSQGRINASLVTGTPDFKRISYLKVIITGGTGRFWLNDIYVSEPETLKDSAHWYEIGFKTTQPLYMTEAGVPVLSDINIKYIEKGHGANFSTAGKTTKDMYEKHRELFSSLNILPNWSSSLSYAREMTQTDNLNEDVSEARRGAVAKNTFNFVSDFKSSGNGIPSISVAYKYDRYINDKGEDIAGQEVDEKTINNVHSPVFNMSEQINNFLGGNLLTKLNMNMLFKKKDISRGAEEINSETLENYVKPEEKEKRQRSDVLLDILYHNKIFFMQPKLTIGSEEIVAMKGTAGDANSDILVDLNGSYHVPFVYNKEFKFVERNKKAELFTGINSTHFFAPTYKSELQYFENSFKDYDSADAYTGFSRARDARSLMITEITFPFNFQSIKKLNFVKNVGFIFNRSLYFTENKLPYEGEKYDTFNEEYGITRSFNGLSNEGLNLFSFYPGYFFAGRNNYANGRDYIYRRFNNPITIVNDQVVVDYNNQLKLIETFSFKWALLFRPLNLDGGIGLNQVAERQNVSGIPGQVITRSFNINLNFDLMEIFSFGFFRPNEKGKPHHSSTLTLGYGFDNNLLITSNIEENTHTPKVGITFKKDRSSIALKGSIDFRKKNDKEFIHLQDDERDRVDDIYITNMSGAGRFREEDKGYKFSIIYETDIKWLYEFFSEFYRLAALPIFSIEYQLALNTYDYKNMVSPEPYDMHLIITKLTLDLHKNIQGGFMYRMALEKFHSRETGGVSHEIFSYELGLNFTLLF